MTFRKRRDSASQDFRMVRRFLAWLLPGTSDPLLVEAPQLSEDDYAEYLDSIGIRAETGDGEWCCCECLKMQHVGSPHVWIPDGTRKGDPLWSVLAQCRRWAHNGHFSAWCLPCCQSFRPMSAEEMARAGQTPHDPIPVITLFLGGRPKP